MTQYEKVAIISDIHSTFVDKRAFDLFLQIYTENKFDRLIMNGDVFDFPTISEHSKKIETFRPKILRDYVLDEELDFVENFIFRKIHKAQPKTPITMRTGNHEWRWMRPNATNARAIADILETSRRRGTLKLEDMLNFQKYNAELSIHDVDILNGKFVLTHGNKLGKNRCEKYLQEFSMSGTSGHSHQGLRAEKTLYNKPDIEWVESFCLRTIRNIEYMGQGFIPNWSHGFVDVWFTKNSNSMHIKQHKFKRNYSYVYQGVTYQS